jgi:hypothetical protein
MMEYWRNMTHKHKYFFVLVAGAIVAILLYAKAIQPTLILQSWCSEKSHEIERIQNAPIRIAALEVQLLSYDSLLMGDEGTADVSDQVLELLNEFCEQNDIKIIELSVPHEYVSGEFVLATDLITLAGSYHNLLKLCHFIEEKISVVRLASVRYYAKESIRTRTKKLYCDVYIQYVKES